MLHLTLLSSTATYFLRNINIIIFIFQLSHSGTKYSLYFRDEIRSIDFILVWDEFNGEAQTYRNVERRRVNSNYFLYKMYANFMICENLYHIFRYLK